MVENISVNRFLSIKSIQDLFPVYLELRQKTLRIFATN